MSLALSSAASAHAVTQRREESARKLARAREVLDLAERRAGHHGSGIDRAVLRALAPTRGTSGLSAPSAAGEPTGQMLPMPEALRDLFPAGAVRAGSSVGVQGAASTSLLLALAAAAAREEGWCALAGFENLGLRCALQAGLAAERLVLSPVAAAQDAAVLSALIDGMGVVVLGPDLELSAALWRQLTDRARTRDCLLLAASPPGRSDLRITAEGGAWIGLGVGTGRLRQRRVSISAEGRGIAQERHVQVLMPQVTSLLAAEKAARKHAVSGQEAAALQSASVIALHERRAG